MAFNASIALASGAALAAGGRGCRLLGANL
jgi:hypothetical protein